MAGVSSREPMPTQTPSAMLRVVGMASVTMRRPLGTAGAAINMRFTRSSMIEVLNNDYIRTARAKGASWRRVVFIPMRVFHPAATAGARRSESIPG